MYTKMNKISGGKMIKKYQKPIARELGDFGIANGWCLSGLRPAQRCNEGGTNVGPCVTYGSQAGQSCGTGDTPNVPSPNCSRGETATNCGTGNFAALL